VKNIVIFFNSINGPQTLYEIFLYPRYFNSVPNRQPESKKVIGSSSKS